MDTFPIVPEGLERDLGAGRLVIRFKDGDETRSVEVYPWYPCARVRIVLRPFLEVEAPDAEGPGTLTEIPLGSVVSVDVDNPEIRPGPSREGEEAPEEIEVNVPVSRWVLHPDMGLLRFAAQ